MRVVTDSIQVGDKIYEASQTLCENGGGDAPSGTIDINSNGKHDVYNYAEANVNIPVPDLSQTTAETYDVAAGKYFYDKEGDKVEGTLQDRLQWKCDNIKRLEYEFRYTPIENIDVLTKGLDTSQVTSMKYMAANSPALKKLDLGDWNTTNVTNMESLCVENTNLEDVVMSNNFDSLINMSYMFQNCRKLKSVDFKDYEAPNVTEVENMFHSCSSLILINLPQNMSKVTNITHMFYNCTNLEEIDLSQTNFNLEGSSCLQNTFYGCKKLKTINLTNVNTLLVTSMKRMFNTCSELIEIIAPNFNTVNVTDTSSMFYSCSKLVSTPKIDMINVTTTTSMFANCAALTNLYLYNIKVSIQIGSGSSYGHLLTDESFINTAKELHDLTGKTTQTLKYSSKKDSVWDSIYVKLITATDEMIAADPYINDKKPCEVCESTDEGAMTLREYVVSKNWALAKV